MAYIKQIRVGNTNYDIKDASAWTQIDALWNQMGASLVIVKLDSSVLPDASAGGLGKIFLVPDSSSVQPDVYDEYIIVQDNTAQPTVYSWEVIGNTDIELSNYSLNTHRHTYDGRTDADGDHTHSIASPTKKYIPVQGNVPLTFTTEWAISALATSKLATTTIKGVSGTATVATVNASTDVSIAKAGTPVVYGTADVGKDTSVVGAVTGTFVTAAIGDVSLGGATTFNTDAFKASYDSNNERLDLVSASTGTVLLNTVSASTGDVSTTTVTVTPAVDAPYNRTIVPAVDNGTITSYTMGSTTVAKAANSSTTVATGSLSPIAGGADVVTGAASTIGAFTAIDTSVALLKNAAPVTNSLDSSVRVVTDSATITGESGKHEHAYSGTTSQAIAQ